MSQNGKGDDSRPMNITKKEYDDNYERIFGRKYEEPPEDYKKVLISGMFWELFPDLSGSWRLDKHEWHKYNGEQNASK